MRQRQLGHGLEVGAIGLGCMGMSSIYGQADDAQSIATIRRAAEIGVTMIDTADAYGNGQNEGVVGQALRGGARIGENVQLIGGAKFSGQGFQVCLAVARHLGIRICHDNEPIRDAGSPVLPEQNFDVRLEIDALDGHHHSTPEPLPCVCIAFQHDVLGNHGYKQGFSDPLYKESTAAEK